MNDDRNNAAGTRPAHGMSLAELMIAMSLTAVIGAVVVSMLFTAGYGAESQSHLRSLTAAAEVTTMKLDAAIRAGTHVLASGGGTVVLWLGDSTLNGKPNLSELMRIERDPATGELTCYRAPPGLPAKQDDEYALDETDFAAVTGAIKGSAVFPGQLWATGVTAWTIVLPSQAPQQAGHVGYHLTMTDGGESLTTSGGAALHGR